MRSAVTEQRLGEIVVAHLERGGADVYQEVEVSSGVADIVARVGAELWIIEIKTSLSLALLTQAMERRRAAHRVFIAAPSSRNTRDVARICEEIGIGLWCILDGDGSEWDPPRVEERCPSRRWNARPIALAAKLSPEHKTHAKAGSVGAGGRWTPWRRTCEGLAGVVAQHPGITLKSALEQTKHHYRTMALARSSMAAWIREGKVPGVVLRDGALHPAESARG